MLVTGSHLLLSVSQTDVSRKRTTILPRILCRLGATRLQNYSPMRRLKRSAPSCNVPGICFVISNYTAHSVGIAIKIQDHTRASDRRGAKRSFILSPNNRAPLFTTRLKVKASFLFILATGTKACGIWFTASTNRSLGSSVSTLFGRRFIGLAAAHR